MIAYEYVKEGKIAVFLEEGFGKKRVRTGSIIKHSDKEWQYVTTCGYRGEILPSLSKVKQTLENDCE